MFWNLSDSDKQKLKWKYDNIKFRIKDRIRTYGRALQYLWNTPGRLITKWSVGGTLDWYTERRARERSEKRAKHLEAALAVQNPQDVNWREECEKLRAQVRTLRADINTKREALERKNLELDSLHYVWCSGGCEGGVHRYDKKGPEAVSDETVRAAVRNVNRLVEWYNSHEFRHLDEVDEGKVHNRYVYIYGTRALKEAQKVAEECGPEAAWKVVEESIKNKVLRS